MGRVWISRLNSFQPKLILGVYHVTLRALMAPAKDDWWGPKAGRKYFSGWWTSTASAHGRSDKEQATQFTATKSPTSTDAPKEPEKLDYITGLPRKAAFAGRLKLAIQQARTEEVASSLMLLKLRGRKQIIAQHGCATTDRAICEITRRLRAMLNQSEMLARLGEDEFALIAEAPKAIEAHRDAAVHLATAIIDNVRSPVPANDSELFFDASIGIALCRPGNAGGEQLLQSAANAMKRARDAASGFDIVMPGKDVISETRPSFSSIVEADITRALLAGEIQPFYQAMIDLSAKRIHGFEALARWKHPTLGNIMPDAFIPALERSGRISELTESILRQACRDAKLLLGRSTIAINISPSELSEASLSSRILRIIEQEGSAPAQFEIEVTETALVRDFNAAKANLSEFRRAGITTALDDFGTGYSSLAQLRRLKFDKLKIDRCFVQGMLSNRDCGNIVTAVLGLARSMNMRTIAEGIETYEIASSLASRGCEFGQGYYFGQALPAQMAGALLERSLSVSSAA